MNFELSCSDLASHLQAIGNVISGKNNISILNSFLFEIDGKTLTITASDGDNTLITTVELLSASENYRFAINAKLIQDALKGLPEQPVTFEINSETYETTLKYQNGYYSLVSQNADEYPSNTKSALDAGTIMIDANVLGDALTRALTSVSMDNLRPAMTGVYLDITEENTTIVASDGHKLVYTRKNNPEGTKAQSLILPRKSAQLLKSMLALETDDVVVRFDKQRAEVEMSKFHMSCCLIDQRFPDYNKVIPKNNPNTLNINRAALISAIRRMMVFADEVNAALRLHIEANKLTLSAQNLDYSLAAEEYLLIEYDGIPMSVGLKCTTLLEFLGTLQSDEVIFRMADQSRAVIIEPGEQPKDIEIIMLLMPLLLNE